MKKKTKKVMAILTALTLSLSCLAGMHPQNAAAAAKTAVKTMRLQIEKKNVAGKTYQMTEGDTARLSVTTNPKAGRSCSECA